MLHVQQIRKLIYNILTYYYKKENKIKKQKQYYNYNLTEYQSEFECLISEKRIGIYTALNKKDSLICLKLLEMLYERNYVQLLNIYSNNILDTFDNIKLWINTLKIYFINIKINKYKIIPEPLKNYKTKKPQKFYEINDILNNL